MADSLGQGFSDAFALVGAKGVVITARKIETLKETKANINHASPNVEVLPLALEMTGDSSVKAAFDAIRAKFGTVDVLVNNAGLSGSASHFLRDDDMVTWWTDSVRFPDSCLMSCSADVGASDRKSTFVARNSYFLHLLGKERQGTVVFFTSGPSLLMLPGSSSHSITKLSDLQLASYTAAEIENAIAVTFHPGIVDADMTTDF